MESMGGLPENPEEKFKDFWTTKANEWLEEIDKSKMDPISKTRLRTFIEVSFIKAYVNNKDRPSISVFTGPLLEEFGTSAVEESEDVEKSDESRVYQMILEDVRDLYIDPKNN